MEAIKIATTALLIWLACGIFGLGTARAQDVSYPPRFDGVKEDIADKKYAYKDASVQIEMKTFGEFNPEVAQKCNKKKTMKAHNNVDLIRFNNRLYMVYRTAPFHYASTKARLFVTSSDDGKNWKCEREIFMGVDIREPRFLSFKGKLLLYFFEGGKSMFKFEPKHIHACELTADGWTEPKSVGLDGFVPWRLRTQNDSVAVLSAYYGVGLYTGGQENEVRLFTSKDGYKWDAISSTPQVKYRGAEEGEFIFDDDGNLWATVRLEYDGALIAYADKTDLGRWNILRTRSKYDSALMFKQNNEVFVIARRNVDGDYAKTPWWVPHKMQGRYNQMRYWMTTKRTAVYKIDKEKMELVWLFDLPSKGDTAFAGMALLEPNRYLLVNYSNDPTGPDSPWFLGQLGDTRLYAIELEVR